MHKYLTKAPGEEKALAIDWRAHGLAEGETVVTALGWTILPEEIGPDALVLLSETVGSVSTSFVLAGGRPGHVYHVAHRVRTSAGDVLNGSILIRVSLA